MSYTAYERATGSALVEVEALCQHLTATGAFTVTTQPSLEAVESFLTTIHDDLATVLASMGYSTTQTDATVLSFLQRINVFGACMQIELAQPSVGYRVGENTRFTVFREEYNRGLDRIRSGEMASLNVTTSGVLGIAITGVSLSEKSTLTDDTDAVQPFFQRDMLNNYGTSTGNTSDDD